MGPAPRVTQPSNPSADICPHCSMLQESIHPPSPEPATINWWPFASPWGFPQAPEIHYGFSPFMGV